MTMNDRLLPGTDIKVSPITFGAFAIGGWFWGGCDEDDAIKTIETAIENGITTLDTAPVYGMGHSETLIGKVIKGRRSQVQLLTKFGMVWDSQKGDFAFDTVDNDGTPLKIYKYNGKQSIIAECERSLQRLQTDYIDLYQMHWPESVTPVEEIMEAMDLLLQQGKIRSVGVCNCPAEWLEKANSLTPIATNQVAYSMVNRGIEHTLFPVCKANNIGILPHTTLQKGLLTGKIRLGHQFNEGDHREKNLYFRPDNHSSIMDMLSGVKHIADDRHISLSQLAINWTMQQPCITSVLVGARNAEQMLDNVNATTFTLTAQEINEINQLLDQMRIIQ